MSIIGTRPPLISETNLYELHHTFVEILIGAIVYVIVLVVLRDAFVCKYIDKTFHKILGQRRK